MKSFKILFFVCFTQLAFGQEPLLVDLMNSLQEAEFDTKFNWKNDFENFQNNHLTNSRIEMLPSEGNSQNEPFVMVCISEKQENSIKLHYSFHQWEKTYFDDSEGELINKYLLDSITLQFSCCNCRDSVIDNVRSSFKSYPINDTSFILKRDGVAFGGGINYSLAQRFDIYKNLNFCYISIKYEAILSKEYKNLKKLD